MGTVDIYHSRRTCYIECTYWIRDERSSVGDINQWILKNTPSGLFLAKEISPYSNQMNQTSGVYAYDRNSITLESDDDLEEIVRGSIVLYNGKTWMVNDVQKLVHRKETEFNVDLDYKYIINIRR